MAHLGHRLDEAIEQLEWLVDGDFDERLPVINGGRRGACTVDNEDYGRIRVRADETERIRSYIRALRILRAVRNGAVVASGLAADMIGSWIGGQDD